jgi:hypothetical protein
MFHYHAFGLTFSSEMMLTNLLPVAAGDADVAIVRAPVSTQGLEAPQQIRPYRQIASNEFWLQVPGIARFYVTNGSRIVVDADPGADQQSLSVYLLGSCMGVLLHQRHLLVIHGNAVRVGDHCVVFAGPSGYGKSTLAAAFVQRGYQILSDDLCAIDASGRVQPSFPQIKLWQDSAEKLQIDMAALPQVRKQIKKYIYPVAEQFCTTALPIHALYLLNLHNRNSIEFNRVTGAEKMARLIENTYRVRHLRGLDVHAQHLDACGQLANRVRVTHITRPSGGFELDRLVAMIEADLSEVEACA